MIRTRFPRLAVLGLALSIAVIGVVAAACGSSDDGASELAISDTWARQSAEMQEMGAAYATIKGGAEADRLIGVTAPKEIAAEAQIHEVVMADEGMSDDMGSDTGMAEGAMKMQQVDGIDIPAGETVMLKPGGFHIMLMQLAKPLTVGETFDLTLTFEQAGDKTVSFEVRES